MSRCKSWSIRTVLSMIAVAGCSGEPTESVLQRRNRDAAVHSELVLLQDLELNGRPVAQPASSVSIKFGEALRISGRIERGEWGISRIRRFWLDTGDGEVTLTSPPIDPRDKPLYFGVVVHGAEPDVNDGVVFATFVQVRWFPQERVTRFHVDIPAPDEPGDYVIDLNLTDKSVGAQRGEKVVRTKAIPIWRLAITVH